MPPVLSLRDLAAQIRQFWKDAEQHRLTIYCHADSELAIRSVVEQMGVEAWTEVAVSGLVPENACYVVRDFAIVRPLEWEWKI